MNRIFAIAHNTFREAVRNKILYSLLFFAVVLIVSALALGELTLGEQVRLTRDLGLYGIDIFGVLIAIFLGVNLLYKELSLKTIYTILPKPLYRFEFVAGKWIGMLVTLAIQFAVMGAVLYFALFLQDADFELQTAKALFLLYLNVMVITSIALVFSSFSSPFLSGIFALGVFVVGRSISDLQMIGNRAGGMTKSLIQASTYVIPNLNVFFPSGTIVGAERVTVNGQFVNSAYLVDATIYGVGYSLIALFVAIVIFNRRDFV
ncbi:MAG: ABC transporter permease subunit [Deltaproteobacteria bacterium]|nr:ABC transporter permease subunit [Deltaproteobacteria bacterium]